MHRHKKHRLKAEAQLGMEMKSASTKLMRDLLWQYIENSGETLCHACGEPLCRETFTVEHIEKWLDSEDPAGLYFDLNNISFSHQRCNTPRIRPQHRDVNPATKIFTKDIPRIKRLSATGRSARSIAREYKVGHKGILNILNENK